MKWDLYEVRPRRVNLVAHLTCNQYVSDGHSISTSRYPDSIAGYAPGSTVTVTRLSSRLFWCWFPRMVPRLALLALQVLAVSAKTVTYNWEVDWSQSPQMELCDLLLGSMDNGHVLLSTPILEIG